MLDIFKFNSVISVPIFTIIALHIIRQIPKYSFSNTTLSESIYYLKNPKLKFSFKYNFILKGVLDLTFIIYIINFLKIYDQLLLVLIMILSPILFGSLAYFTQDKNKTIHLFIAYISGLLWFTGSFFLSRLIADKYLIQLTNTMIIINILIVTTAVYMKKINIIIQSLCILIMWLWMVILVFKYL